jgi:hypothetical protein
MRWQALPECPSGERAGQDHCKDNKTDDRRIQHDRVTHSGELEFGETQYAGAMQVRVAAIHHG